MRMKKKLFVSFKLQTICNELSPSRGGVGFYRRSDMCLRRYDYKAPEEGSWMDQVGNGNSRIIKGHVTNRRNLGRNFEGSNESSLKRIDRIVKQRAGNELQRTWSYFYVFDRVFRLPIPQYFTLSPPQLPP